MIIMVVGLVVLALLGSVGLWCGICYAVSLRARWPRLRELYAYDRTFEGPTLALSGYVGGSRYRGALVGGANADGIYLNVAAPFRLGAGPVLVPWQDIAVLQSSTGSLTSVTFEFPRAGTKLRLPENAAGPLLARRPAPA